MVGTPHDQMIGAGADVVLNSAVMCWIVRESVDLYEGQARLLCAYC